MKPYLPGTKDPPVLYRTGLQAIRISRKCPPQGSKLNQYEKNRAKDRFHRPDTYPPGRWSVPAPAWNSCERWQQRSHRTSCSRRTTFETAVLTRDWQQECAYLCSVCRAQSTNDPSGRRCRFQDHSFDITASELSQRPGDPGHLTRFVSLRALKPCWSNIRGVGF